MNGIGSIVAVVFGIFWTIMTLIMGAPFFFPIFGVIFIIVGIIQAIYNFKNATSKNRFSEYDIVPSDKEEDYFNEHFSKKGLDHDYNQNEMGEFCPYCGSNISPDYEYCSKCGKKLPK